jgi:uncharacterized membrane protein YtjA (UPF0391 family)
LGARFARAAQHARALTGTFAIAVTYLCNDDGEVPMLKWALIFLVVGLIAGLLGFTGIAGASIAIAKILFFVFMAIFLVLLVAGLTVANRLGGP